MDKDEIKQIATDVYNELGTQYKVPTVPIHTHTGMDTNRILFVNIAEKFLPIHWTVVGTSAATATNYGVFWEAPFKCVIMNASEVHQIKGTDAGGVTLQIERLQSTEAPDAGDALLSTAFDLKGTNNTVQYGALVNDISLRQLAKGDRICLKDAGVLTAVANVTVMITILYN